MSLIHISKLRMIMNSVILLIFLAHFADWCNNLWTNLSTSSKLCLPSILSFWVRSRQLSALRDKSPTQTVLMWNNSMSTSGIFLNFYSTVIISTWLMFIPKRFNLFFIKNICLIISYNILYKILVENQANRLKSNIASLWIMNNLSS